MSYERKEDILKLSADIYEYIENKIMEHKQFAEEVMKGCEKLGYKKYIPPDYVDGYESALLNITRMIDKIKIGG